MADFAALAVPTYTPLPPAPSRSMAPAAFIAASTALIAALPALVVEAVALDRWMAAAKKEASSYLISKAEGKDQ